MNFIAERAVAVGVSVRVHQAIRLVGKKRALVFVGRKVALCLLYGVHLQTNNAKGLNN